MAIITRRTLQQIIHEIDPHHGTEPTVAYQFSQSRNFFHKDNPYAGIIIPDIPVLQTQINNQIFAQNQPTTLDVSVNFSGATPMTFSLFSGSIPSGMTLTSAGLITGTPDTIANNIGIVVQASNAFGQAFTNAFGIDVQAAVVAPAFSGTIPAQSWTQNQAISPIDVASYLTAGTFPLTFSIASGSLPSGVMLNSSSGVISGIPVVYGDFNSVSIQASNSAGSDTTNVFNISVAQEQQQSGPLYVNTGYWVAFFTDSAAIPLTKFQSGEIGSVDLSTVVITFTDDIESPGDDYAAGVTIEVDGTPVTINSATRQTNNAIVHYVVNTTINQESTTIRFKYDQSVGDLKGANDVAPIQGDVFTSPVTGLKVYEFDEDIPHSFVDTIAPNFISGTIDSPGDVLVVQFSEDISSPALGYAAGVTIEVDSTPVTITSGTRRNLDNSVVEYQLASSVAAGQTVTWEYNAGSGDIEDKAASPNALATIGAQSCTNNVIAPGAALVSFSMDTSNTDTITSTGFGTPTAALIMMNHCSAVDTDTTGGSWNVYTWAASTGNLNGISSSFEHGQTNTDSETNIRDGLSILSPDGTFSASDGTVSQITDGLQINWDDPPNSTHRGIAILFKGLSASAGTLNMSGSTGTVTSFDTWGEVTGSATAPQLFMAFTHNNNSQPNNVGNGGKLSFGCGINDGTGGGTQFCFGGGDDHNETTTKCLQAKYDDAAVHSAGNVSNRYQITSWNTPAAGPTGGGLDIYHTSNSDRNVPYLLLGGLSDINLRNHQTPAGTGADAVSSLSFQPDLLLSMFTAWDDWSGTTTQYDMMMTVGVADGTNEHSISTYNEGWRNGI